MNLQDFTHGMGFVAPITIDRAKLVTNVPASTLIAWAPGTPYALGAEVIDVDTRIVYRSMAAGNQGNPITDATKWQNRGVENRLAMFDESLGTTTSNAELIEIEYPPGQVVTNVILFQLAAQEVQVLLVQRAAGVPDDVLFDSGNLSTLKPSGNSHWGYFFERLESEDRVHISGIPAYTQATLIIRIKAPGGTAKCGEAFIGRVVWLGNTYWRPAISFDEWGEKTRDKWGGWTVSPDAPYSDRMELQVLVEGTQYERTKQRVLKVRRRPVVWIGAQGYIALLAYGYITSFKQILVSHGISDCQMVIEGTEITE